MHKTPKRIFEELLLERPFCERRAVLNDHECQGKSTFEHAFIYAGKQIPDKWAVIRLCEWAHSVGPYATNGGMNKAKNHWLALRHATPQDLAKYPKADWARLKSYLDGLYANDA